MFFLVADSLNGKMSSVPKIKVCAMSVTEPSLAKHGGSTGFPVFLTFVFWMIPRQFPFVT